MKWYFACNDRSPDYEYMIKAAVESAVRNTSLKPVMLYDGAANSLTEWASKQGVEVIAHRVSFYSALEAFYSPDLLPTASGTFLRCDIPIIETDDECVLYTDCDVLFTETFDLPEPPKLFACAPETHPQDWSILNAGVMVMNVPALRQSHAAFKSFIEDQLPTLTTFDQSAYNRFYAAQHTQLPLEYNWKTYWGKNPNAKIIHFHGPKPKDLLHILNGGSVSDIYRDLFSMNRFGCIHYLSEFGRYSDPQKFSSEQVFQKGAEFLATRLQDTELELKTVIRRQLKTRVRKHLNSLRKRIGAAR